MTELGLDARIVDFLLLDITDLKEIANNQYDVVTCVGGALNYTFDKEQAAIKEMLRVVKPGGVVIIGVMSFLNSLIRFLPGIVEEKGLFGIDATKWLMETGIQDAEHYPVENKNYVHMMMSKELDSLFDGLNVQILEKRAAAVFSMAGEEALDLAKADQELWEVILGKEIECSRNPACLDCGANIIYVVKKL
jgi:SAM-dependent methyltransferase